MANKQQNEAAQALLANREQIAAHIESLRANAADLRRRIGELRQCKDKISNTSISRSEFIRLMCEGVDRVADTVDQRIARDVESFVDRSKGNARHILMGSLKTSGKVELLPIINEHAGVGPLFSLEYLVSILREPIKETLRCKVADRVRWPFEDAIEDIGAAGNEISQIDADLRRLSGELSELVALAESFGQTI